MSMPKWVSQYTSNAHHHLWIVHCQLAKQVWSNTGSTLPSNIYRHVWINYDTKSNKSFLIKYCSMPIKPWMIKHWNIPKGMIAIWDWPIKWIIYYYKFWLSRYRKDANLDIGHHIELNSCTLDLNGSNINRFITSHKAESIKNFFLCWRSFREVFFWPSKVYILKTQ